MWLPQQQIRRKPKRKIWMPLGCDSWLFSTKLRVGPAGRFFDFVLRLLDFWIQMLNPQQKPWHRPKRWRCWDVGFTNGPEGSIGDIKWVHAAFVDQVAKRNSPLPSHFTPQHGPSTFFLCVSIKGKGQCQEEGRTKKRSNLSSEKKCLTFEPMKKPVLGFVRFKVLELRIGTKPTVVVTSRPDEPDRRGWLDQTKRYRRVSIGMSFWELWLFFGTIRLYNYKLLLSLSLSLSIYLCVYVC